MADKPGVNVIHGQDAEKNEMERQRKASRASVTSNAEILDEALDTLNISTKDADEAFAYLRDHPNADTVRQEALDILADPKATRKLLWKIDLTIVPCMIAVYFLQFLYAVQSLSFCDVC